LSVILSSRTRLYKERIKSCRNTGFGEKAFRRPPGRPCADGEPVAPVTALRVPLKSAENISPNEKYIKYHLKSEFYHRLIYYCITHHAFYIWRQGERLPPQDQPDGCPAVLRSAVEMTHRKGEKKVDADIRRAGIRNTNEPTRAKTNKERSSPPSPVFPLPLRLFRSGGNPDVCEEQLKYIIRHRGVTAMFRGT